MSSVLANLEVQQDHGVQAVHVCRVPVQGLPGSKVIADLEWSVVS